MEFLILVIVVLVGLIIYELIRINNKITSGEFEKEYSEKYHIKYKIDEWKEYMDKNGEIIEDHAYHFEFISYKAFKIEFKNMLHRDNRSLIYSRGKPSLYRIYKTQDDKLILVDYITPELVGNLLGNICFVINAPEDYIKYQKFINKLFANPKKCMKLAGRILN